MSLLVDYQACLKGMPLHVHCSSLSIPLLLQAISMSKFEFTLELEVQSKMAHGIHLVLSSGLHPMAQWAGKAVPTDGIGENSQQTTRKISVNPMSSILEQGLKSVGGGKPNQSGHWNLRFVPNRDIKLPFDDLFVSPKDTLAS